MKTLFITGTDTSVGKTFIAGLLLRFLKEKGIAAGYQKWVSTGDDPPEDVLHCLKTAGLDFDSALLDLQTPYRFKFPASPHLAAELENGAPVEADAIIAAFNKMRRRYEQLVVEGVGGVLVPLSRDLLLADLLGRLKLPTLVVARTGLGTLNHTLLTLEALRRREIPVLGVVLTDSGPDEEAVLARDNLRTIAELGRVRVFGRMVWAGDPEAAWEMFSPIGEAVLAAMDRS